MNFKQVALKAGRTVSKYSPEIFTAVGISGFGATIYLAYKSRGNVEQIVNEIEDMRINDEHVSKSQVMKDLGVSLYLPITVGILSTGSILMANQILRKRIITLSGALAAQQVQNKYFENKYRKIHGDEAYNQFIVPTKQETVDKVGAKGKVTQTVSEVKQEIDSTVGEWYDKSSEYASDDHTYNVAYIESVSESLQTRLFQRGNLLLNEVREELGFSRIRAGALLGWTTADHFDITQVVTNLGDEEAGELKQQIYVTWERPRYIYDDVEFNNRYSTY